jgi:hypothetical protein
VSGALVYALDGVDRVVKRHVELWISDYVGLWEDRMQITRGNTRRPDKSSYRRSEDFPPTLTFGEPQATSYKLGVLPRLYMNALVELFKQERVLVESELVVQVVSAVAFTEPEPVGDDRWAHTLIGLKVDAPIADLTKSFNTPPDGPNLPPRTPDVPVVVDQINIYVEARP